MGWKEWIRITPAHYWAPFGCFFIADLLYQALTRDTNKYFSKGLFNFTEYLAMFLFFYVTILMMIRMCVEGKEFIKILKEEKAYCELSLFFPCFMSLAVMGFVYFEGCYSSFKIMYWLHPILFFIYLIYGLYLWIFEDKNFVIPQIGIVTLCPFVYDLCARNYDAGYQDNALIYKTISILCFFIFFFVILATMKDKDSEKLSPAMGVSYVIIVMAVEVFYFQFSELDMISYGILILWIILLILIIKDLIAKKFIWINIVVHITALSAIGMMWLRNTAKPESGNYVRSIYGTFTLIGMYFSFICMFLIIIAFIFSIIFGEGLSMGGGQSKGKVSNERV